MYMYMRMLLAYCLAGLGVRLVLLMLLFRNLRHIVRALRTQNHKWQKCVCPFTCTFKRIYNLWGPLAKAVRCHDRWSVGQEQQACVWKQCICVYDCRMCIYRCVCVIYYYYHYYYCYIIIIIVIIIIVYHLFIIIIIIITTIIVTIISPPF